MILTKMFYRMWKEKNTNIINDNRFDVRANGIAGYFYVFDDEEREKTTFTRLRITDYEPYYIFEGWHGSAVNCWHLKKITISEMNKGLTYYITAYDSRLGKVRKFTAFSAKLCKGGSIRPDIIKKRYNPRK